MVAAEQVQEEDLLATLETDGAECWQSQQQLGEAARLARVLLAHVVLERGVHVLPQPLHQLHRFQVLGVCGRHGHQTSDGGESSDWPRGHAGRPADGNGGREHGALTFLQASCHNHQTAARFLSRTTNKLALNQHANLWCLADTRHGTAQR